LLQILSIVPTRILTENFLKEFNIKTTFYDPHDLKTLEKSITKNTKLIFVENPGSNSFDFKTLAKLFQLQKNIKF
jgi:cystathionine beta-lyase